MEHVTVVVRRPVDVAQLFGLSGSAADKVRVVQVEDLRALETQKDVRELLGRCTVGVGAVGTYTSLVRSEEEFAKVEVGLNESAARAMRAAGCRRFAYLSGQGVDPARPTSGALFSRVKGRAEVTLARVFAEENDPASFTALRPGFIAGQSDNPVALYRWMEPVFGTLAPRLNLGAHIDDIGKAFCHALLSDETVDAQHQAKPAGSGVHYRVWENADILAAARRHDDEKAKQRAH